MQKGYHYSAWVSLWILMLMCNHVIISLGELVSVSNCTCPGYELKLQCTITGFGFVEWKGTALYDNCTISFRTSEFEPGISGGSCNNGNIVGHWIKRQGQNYTSQLTILVDTMLSGKNVICVNNNLRHDITVGEYMITLTTDYPFEPPSDVRVVDVGLKMLTFKWSGSQNLDLSCGAIHYNISATGCGVCPSSTSNTSVTCSDVTLSPNSTMSCSFSVLPFVCSNITGNISNTAFSDIALESPSAPSFKSITPRYSSTSKLLIKLEIEILRLDSVTNQNIYSEILSTTTSIITSYTINVYSDSSGSCASVDIPASSCVGKSCIQVFDNLNKSCLTNSAQIVVTAFASNYFGRGLQSVPMFVGTNNTHFDVDYDFTKGILYCHFSEWHSQDEINKSCSLVYGLLQNFENCEISLRNRNISIETFSNQDSVIIPISKISTDELVYCFVAKGTVMMMTIAIEGTFKWGKKTSSAIDVQKTIIPTVSCIVVTLIIITIASGVIIIKRWKRYQSPSFTQQNIYVSCTGPHGDLKHSTGEVTYVDIQPCLSEVQSVPLDDDVVVYAEVNHELALVDKPGPAASSQQRTCISKQSEDEGQHTDNTKSQTSRNLPNLDNLLIKLRFISHQWYQFGLAVGVSQNVLDNYNSEFPPDQCLVKVLDYWLTHHHSKPTWQDVTKALNEMKLFHLAENTSRELEYQTVPDTVSQPMDSL